MCLKQILSFEDLGQTTKLYLNSATELNNHLEKFYAKRYRSMPDQTTGF